MKNKLVFLILILVVLFGVVLVLLFVRGDEDTWLCQNNEWVKHGNPSSAKPETGCGLDMSNEDNDVGTVNIANPASTNCINKGGELVIKIDASGGQAGVCKSPTGQECDEWAFFRGECSW